MKLREIVEAILFLPAMALLAAVIGAAAFLLIAVGNYAVYGWYWLLRQVAGLPHSTALALTVIASALTIYAAFWWLNNRGQPAKR